MQAGDTLWSIAASHYGGDTARGASGGSRTGTTWPARSSARAQRLVCRSRLSRAALRLAARLAGMDLDVVFLGTAGSMPTADRVADRAARAPRRRAAALRLRRGHAAPAAPLDARADRPPRGLPHPLPRRPLPRAAGDAEDVRAARPRACRSRSTARPGSSSCSGRCAGSSAGSPTRYELEELRPGETLDRGDYRLVTFPVAHGVSSIGYALVEDDRPGRFDVETADALGVPSGPGARRAPARRAGHARRRDDRHARPGARASRGRAARS